MPHLNDRRPPALEGWHLGRTGADLVSQQRPLIQLSSERVGERQDYIAVETTDRLRGRYNAGCIWYDDTARRAMSEGELQYDSKNNFEDTPGLKLAARRRRRRHQCRTVKSGESNWKERMGQELQA